MIAGIDEAGRGPVIGPMIACGVLFDKSSLRVLEAAGVKDSKLLSPAKRSALAYKVLGTALRCEIVELQPPEIDHARRENRLNELEAQAFAQIIDRLRPAEAFIDSPDADPKRFRQRLERYLTHRPKLIVENFADKKYVQVAAASIVAKARRERRSAELRSRYGDFGSGYPADPRTLEFLKRWLRDHGSLPQFVRKSWKTLERLR
jgi:ribonuclease HII